MAQYRESIPTACKLEHLGSLPLPAFVMLGVSAGNDNAGFPLAAIPDAPATPPKTARMGAIRDPL
jgi:hypothetical protein